jgi:hypothetical protein
MKAIVVVKLAAEQPLVIWIGESSKGVALAGADKTNRVDESTTHNESAPPFWTWFIENPRPHLEIFP